MKEKVCASVWERERERKSVKEDESEYAPT